MSYPCTDDPNEIIEYVAAAKSNATKFNTFVNGTSTQTVQLGTGAPTPTIRKFIADAQSVVATAANDAAETVLDTVADMKLNKADKYVPAEARNIALLAFDGNLGDSGRTVGDFTPLLSYAKSEAQELIWQNAMAFARYKDWLDEEADRHKRDMDEIAYANNEALELVWQNRTSIECYSNWRAHGVGNLEEANVNAMKAVQGIRGMIDAFDESVAQHRLQIRLFEGSNPTSSSKPVLFVVSGQSNAVGGGEYGAFDHAEDCGMFWSWADGANVLKPIVDPTAVTHQLGSQWPEFARRFFALTGRKIILLNLASGGAAVTDGGSDTFNTWADNGYGTLRSSRQTIWDAFSDAVPSTSYDMGAILWSQGEAEAIRIYGGTATVAQYKEATFDILSWTRTLIGATTCPVLNCMIGYRDLVATNQRLKDSYEAIQNAQIEIFNSSNGLYNICSMPPLFANAWDEYMYGVIHYGPIGYKIVGDAFARASAHCLQL